MMKTGLVFHPDSTLHDTGSGHPESIDRYHKIEKSFHREGMFELSTPLIPEHISDQNLYLCHNIDYVFFVEEDINNHKTTLRTGDTNICPASLLAAKMAAGGALKAVDAVVKGEVDNAFCVARPPGHHANQSKGMGFCVFNNIALAARYAQKELGISNVLIIDWDVHHGNGTQDIFYEDETVHFFSTHQYPLYPGTGHPDETGIGIGKGTTTNIPIEIGDGRKGIFEQAFKRRLSGIADVFKPELILISAGFDSHRDDPLGGLSLIERDFGDMTQFVMELAAKHCNNRVVSILEGGYHLEALANSSLVHMQTLLDL